MNKSSRYILIGLVVVIFFILAPLLILYISGTRLHLNSNATSNTGILDIKSQPNGASVSLDDQDKDSTPTIIRFLTQGEYLLKISKPGYYDWGKRLPVESGQVTYAQEGVDAVQLIKKPEPKILVPEGVSSFTLIDDTLWFARGNSVVQAPISDPDNQSVIQLSFAPKSVQRLRDKTHLFLSGDTAHAVVDTQTNTAYPINFSFDANDASVINNILMVNIGEVLRAYDLNTNAETILRDDVLGFTMLDSTAYFVDKTGTISTAIWDGSSLKNTEALLSNQPIPVGKTQLIITDRKELFLKDYANNFYRVNQKLDLVANQAEAATLDLVTNELTIRTSSELLFYNFLINKPQLLTRSTQRANDFLIRSDIGYGFAGSASGLEVIEIDSRDQQNRYPLLSGGPVWQIAITNNQKTIVALQNGALVAVEIRD